MLVASRPSVLDNFALLSGQLNTINKLLRNEKTPSFRNQVIIPLLLSPDRDEDLAVSMAFHAPRADLFELVDVWNVYNYPGWLSLGENRFFYFLSCSFLSPRSCRWHRNTHYELFIFELLNMTKMVLVVFHWKTFKLLKWTELPHHWLFQCRKPLWMYVKLKDVLVWRDANLYCSKSSFKTLLHQIPKFRLKSIR